MKLVKVKGIVIKEVTYSDNDKIITLLTDSLGLITCMAKGSKRTNSPILASSQYLVYSEFILFKGTTFYHVNSASTITTFYKLRIDFDKLSLVFEVTKNILSLTDENMDTSDILKLFLNTLYVLENMDKDPNFVISIFKIKFFSLLGFTPQLITCNICGKNFKENGQDVKYNYINNSIVCTLCDKEDRSKYLELSFKNLMAIRYIVYSDIKKIFSFTIDEKEMKNFNKFAEAFSSCITGNM